MIGRCLQRLLTKYRQVDGLILCVYFSSDSSFLAFFVFLAGQGLDLEVAFILQSNTVDLTSVLKKLVFDLLRWVFDFLLSRKVIHRYIDIYFGLFNKVQLKLYFVYKQLM